MEHIPQFEDQPLLERLSGRLYRWAAGRRVESLRGVQQRTQLSGLSHKNPFLTQNNFSRTTRRQKSKNHRQGRTIDRALGRHTWSLEYPGQHLERCVKSGTVSRLLC